MLESLNYSFRNSKNIIWVIYRIKQLRNYKKTMWRGFANIPHHTERHTHTPNKRYAATSPRLTFKNFKLSDFLKFSDFETPTNSLMMIY